MAARHRSLCFAAALVVALAAFVGTSGTTASAQDQPTTTVPDPFGGVASTTALGATTATSETVPESSQTVTEGGSEERSLLTESRKVLATIAGLVIAALGLALLTVRYWRATKPVPPELGMSARSVSTAVVVDEDLPTVDQLPSLTAGRRSRRSVAGADHARADDDWEPRGTGEHAVVEIPARRARPPRSARAAALARSSDT